MKKNFFKKKLASALALALVVASFSPAGISAQAATATKIVKQGGGAAPAVLYVGGSKVDYSLSTIKSGVKYTWKSSNTKIATITATTGVVTAKAPGSVTITATATNKKTGKVLNTFKKTLTVNLRSTSVELGDDFTLATGETKKLAATLTPSNSTDVINYVSSDKAIATVGLTGGVVTGKEAGEATITVYAKATKSSSNKSTKTKVDTVKVTVPVGVTSVKQVSDVSLDLTFNKAMTKDTIKASDLVLKNAANNAVQAIKELKFSADGKVVTAVTYLPLTDKAEYKLTYAEKDYKFTASVGEVASIVIKTTQVAFGTDSAIEYNFLDANGIQLTNVDASRVAVAIDTTGGYIIGSGTSAKINLFAKGNTATVTVTYHTWKYENNAEKTVVAKGTIVAVDPTEITIGNYEKYTISGASVDWSKDAVTTIAIGDTGKKIYLHVKDSADKYVTADKITYKAADANYLLVGTDGSLTAVKEGTTYVIATTGKTSFTLPVTVVAKRDASSVELDKTAVTISNTDQVVDTVVIKATAKDQYGSNLATTTVTDVEQKSTKTALNPTATWAGDKITVTATNAVAGTYSFVATVNGKPVAFNVTVLDAKAASVTDPSTLGTQLVLSTNSLDTKITSTTAVADKDLTIKLARYNNGALYDYVKSATVKVTTPGAVGGATETLTLNADGVATFNGLTTDGVTVTKADKGTYKVVVTYNSKDFTQYFVVNDTQVVPSFSVDKVVTEKLTADDIAKDVLTIKDADGNTLTSTIKNTVFKTVTGTIVSGSDVYLDKVTVTQKVGSLSFDVVVTIGQSVKVK
jgi:hypothetical protein